MDINMKNRFVGFAAVCVAIPAVLVAQPNEKKQLVGVWKVEVARLGQSQPALLSLAMFSEDGSFTTSVGYKSLPPYRRGSGRCDGDRSRLRTMGRRRRKRVPAHFLFRDVEGRSCERIPTSLGQPGLVGLRRRVHRTQPGGLFGCELKCRAKHHS
jgi:hypothetical protein